MARYSVPLKRTPLEDRFWPKVDKLGPDDCWLWRASRDGAGYGMIKIGGGAKGNYRAHQASLIIAGKSRPTEDHCALHTCDNPSCVNPSHLWWGTKTENNRDRATKGRSANMNGMRSSRSKLDDEAIRIIRGSKDDNAAMAQRFSVTKENISMIRLRKTWKHVA